MNQKLILKIIRLSRDILVSYIRRQYSRLKRMFWKDKIKKEKINAEKAIATAEESVAAAEYLAGDFESQYQEYLRKRAMRPASARLSPSSAGSEKSNTGSEDSD